MKLRSINTSARLACVSLLSLVSACTSSEADLSFAPDGFAGAGPGDAPRQESPAAGAGAGGGAAASPVVTGSGEGNPAPGDIAGLGGASGVGPVDAPGSGAGGAPSGAAGAADAGAPIAAGAGGAPGAPADCDVLPEPSALVGWAAVAGRGLDTTTGGGDAAPVLVENVAALQAAAAGAAPAVILVRGVLEPADIEIGSNKTIVGTCGAEVHGHLELSESTNVIIQNLTIVGYGEGDCSLDPDFDPSEGCSSGVDAISVQRDSHHIWFDHCAVRDGTDGNLDITNGADFVTVSWTKFSYTPRTDDVGDDSTGAAGHRFSNLVGGTDNPDDFDDESSLNVTWHHNWWADNVVERQPRVRFGNNHLFNNYYNSATTNYCVRAGIGASLLLEGNFFEGVDDPHEFNDEDDEATASILADATNTYVGTTSDRATGGGGPAFAEPPYDYTVDDAATLVEQITALAGPR